MKLFDVVNEADEVIGQASAQECHANPKLLHRVVHFTLVDAEQDKILLTLRPSRLAFDGGKWYFLGEHVLAGGDVGDAIYQGLKDELGIERVNSGEWSDRHIFEYASQRELARFMVGYYHKEKPLKPNPNEIADVKWLTLAELIEHKTEHSQITQYWIEHVSWNKAFSMAKKGGN